MFLASTHGSTPIILVIILTIVFIIGASIYSFEYYKSKKKSEEPKYFSKIDKLLKQELKDKSKEKIYEDIKSSLIKEDSAYKTGILYYLSQKSLQNLTIFTYLGMLENDDFIVAEDLKETSLYRIIIFRHNDNLLVDKIYIDEDQKYILPKKGFFIPLNKMNKDEEEIFLSKVKEFIASNSSIYKLED